jgi:hypothetical protein
LDEESSEALMICLAIAGLALLPRFLNNWALLVQMRKVFWADKNLGHERKRVARPYFSIAWRGLCLRKDLHQTVQLKLMSWWFNKSNTSPVKSISNLCSTYCFQLQMKVGKLVADEV